MKQYFQYEAGHPVSPQAFEVKEDGTFVRRVGTVEWDKIKDGLRFLGNARKYGWAMMNHHSQAFATK